MIRTAELSSIHNGQDWEVLASLGSGGAGDALSSSLRVRSVTMNGVTGELVDLTSKLHNGDLSLSEDSAASALPQWAKFSTGNHSQLALEFHCVGDCSLFALRNMASSLAQELRSTGDARTLA